MPCRQRNQDCGGRSGPPLNVDFRRHLRAHMTLCVIWRLTEPLTRSPELRLRVRGVPQVERTVRAPYNTTSGRDCAKSLRLCLHGTCPQNPPHAPVTGGVFCPDQIFLTSAVERIWYIQDSQGQIPLSSEYGIYKTVKARIWP